MVEFRLILSSCGMTHISTFVPITNLDMFSTYDPAHGTQTFISSEAKSTAKSLPDNIKSKIRLMSMLKLPI